MAAREEAGAAAYSERERGGPCSHLSVLGSRLKSEKRLSLRCAMVTDSRWTGGVAATC